jgi:peptidyl-prolyl cis-trans isomerase B (cyclophilin B)
VLRYLTTLLALLALLAVSGCGDDDSGSGDKGSGAAPAADSTAPADTTEAETAANTDTSAAGGPAPTKCLDVEAPKPKPDGGQQRPKSKLDPARTYEIDFETSCGDFTVRLDPKLAPNTTASFASLARDGFFDDTTFHRIVTGFVIQGGDPTASGNGGPGYSTRDRPPAGATYPRGIVAMGKTATEPSGTAGSQFFVVTGAKVPLPAQYAIIGKVVEGMDAVMRLAKLADPNDTGTGTPLRPAVIEQATLRTSS